MKPDSVPYEEGKAEHNESPLALSQWQEHNELASDWETEHAAIEEIHPPMTRMNFMRLLQTEKQQAP